MLRAQNDSARTSSQPSAICEEDLTIPVLYLTNRLCSCGHDPLRNATCYRWSQHWKSTFYLIFSVRDHPNNWLKRNQKGCKQQRDKHLRQFKKAWYGIALVLLNVVENKKNCPTQHPRSLWSCIEVWIIDRYQLRSAAKEDESVYIELGVPRT
jgi:hypothetical protein